LFVQNPRIIILEGLVVAANDVSDFAVLTSGKRKAADALFVEFDRGSAGAGPILAGRLPRRLYGRAGAFLRHEG
ncbi:MAG TPA: hypothetical protein PKI53_12485, partial [Candidatus Aminicenantes bacterium]|nr:hypothetical protein [Candidatus Aminicenantes bacterium]HNT33269.1 hypothetical protein [Candidatus Aminicenantes bacterium]